MSASSSILAERHFEGLLGYLGKAVHPAFQVDCSRFVHARKVDVTLSGFLQQLFEHGKCLAPA
jgi:hypothetical protein